MPVYIDDDGKEEGKGYAMALYLTLRDLNAQAGVLPDTHHPDADWEPEVDGDWAAHVRPTILKMKRAWAVEANAHELARTRWAADVAAGRELA